jgi:hypothetical protein
MAVAQGSSRVFRRGSQGCNRNVGDDFWQVVVSGAVTVPPVGSPISTDGRGRFHRAGSLPHWRPSDASSCTALLCKASNVLYHSAAVTTVPRHRRPSWLRHPLRRSGASRHGRPGCLVRGQRRLGGGTVPAFTFPTQLAGTAVRRCLGALTRLSSGEGAVSRRGTGGRWRRTLPNEAVQQPLRRGLDKSRTTWPRRTGSLRTSRRTTRPDLRRDALAGCPAWPGRSTGSAGSGESPRPK